MSNATGNLSREKLELFETMPIRKAVIKLSVPTVIGCLVMVMYSMVDTLFVGMLNDSVQTSAVTLVAPVILLFNVVNNLFGVGTGSMMSRALGSREYETVKRTSSFGFYAALLCGLLFSLVAIVFKDGVISILGTGTVEYEATYEYLKWTVFFGAAPAILNVVMGNMVRSEGSSMHASIGTVSGCLLNIVLDPVFIFPWGFGMGAAGAGLATFISNCVATLYFFIYIISRRGKTFVCIDPSYMIPSKTIVREVFGVGIPAAIQNLLNVTGMTILNNLMAFYGTEALSAIGISHKLTMIPMYFSMGIGQGVMPLIGYNFTAGNKKRIKDSLAFTVKMSATIVISLVLLFFVFSDSFMQMFMKNSLVVEYGSAFIRGQCLAIPFFALDFLGVGVFQACGFGKYSLFFAIARKIVLEIPAMFILNKLFPMYGIAYSQLCAEVVLAFASAMLMKHIVSER